MTLHAHAAILPWTHKEVTHNQNNTKTPWEKNQNNFRHEQRYHQKKSKASRSTRITGHGRGGGCKLNCADATNVLCADISNLVGLGQEFLPLRDLSGAYMSVPIIETKNIREWASSPFRCAHVNWSRRRWRRTSEKIKVFSGKKSRIPLIPQFLKTIKTRSQGFGRIQVLLAGSSLVFQAFETEIRKFGRFRN